jgi:hypothetical protein
MKINMGSKVRLKSDYEVHSILDLQPGDSLDIYKHKVKIYRQEPRRSNPIIPTGSIGLVEEGPYCGGIFDYSKETPVKFENHEELGIAVYQGIPTELLEVIEDPVANLRNHPSGLFA